MIELGLTIQDTFNKPNMRSVFKGERAQAGFTVVRVLVTRFMSSFGFSTKLDESQIDTITVDTLENFSYESVEDVVLFFKMCRSGKFGATKRGVDSNLIYGEWLPKYLELKAELRELNHRNNKSEITKIETTLEDVKITYDKVKEKNKINKIQMHIDSVTKNMDRQMLEDLITDWEKDPIRKPYVNMLKIKRKTI